VVLPPDSLVLEGRFRVLRPIGSGGMGEVYLGEQVSLGRKVAIKVLHHDLHKQHGMVERFKREARLLSAVEHPAVVRIIDFGESGDAACLVMELVEGQSLFELLRSGPLAPARALQVLHQLAEGLAAIHDKGIIHRDIKPENIYLSPTPRGEQARLLDFGIARLVEPDADSAVSQIGVVLGTPEYLSPEQAIGARVDARSDLYCLGVVAYRVLSGRLPFDGPDPRKYIAQHANVAPLPLDQAAPWLAPHRLLVALVMRLLEKDPANRFQNAHVLAEALAAVAAGPLPTLTPPGIQAPSESAPVSSGTAAFGAAPAGQGPHPESLPPTGSGTAVFGMAPDPAVSQPPPAGSPQLSQGSPTFSVPWERERSPSNAGSCTATAPASSVPWDFPESSSAAPAEASPQPPQASSSTAAFGVAPPPPSLPPPTRGGKADGGAPSLLQKVRALLSHRTGRLGGLGLTVGLLLAGGVGLWLRERSPEVQARRLLKADKPAEALRLLDAVPAADRKAPDILELRALALHALKRHRDEHAVLLGLPVDSRKDLEKRTLDGLAEDFGADEGDKALRKLLGSLPKDALHDRFEALAEGKASPKQWGALRYLEASQDTAGLDLVELYSTALALEDCEVRAKAARRLGALGNRDAVPALKKLAEQPRNELPGAKNCGQDEAAASLQTLQKSN
jgi:serine/threonine protein kinase